MASSVKGQLLIKVLEASGENKDKQQLWDENFVNGFVKVEIRGGSRTVKAQSTQQRVTDRALRWNEDLTLNILEDAKELRLMLCRERKSSTTGKTSAAVTSACGIYVKEILENVPIDKYFELFKPSSGAEGGTIHIQVEYKATEALETTQENGSPSGLRSQASEYDSDNLGSPATPARHGRTRFADDERTSFGDDDRATVREDTEDKENATDDDPVQAEKKKGLLVKLLGLAAAAAAVGVGAKVVSSKR